MRSIPAAGGGETDSWCDGPMTNTRSPLIVLKFGGTSVSSAANWANIARVVRERMSAGYIPFVVHSALSGITDKLEALLVNALQARHAPILGEIEARHTRLAADLGVALPAGVRTCLDELTQLAGGIALVGEVSDRVRARVMSNGELMATHLGVAYLATQGFVVDWLDARQILRSEAQPGSTERSRLLSATCDYSPDASLKARAARPGVVYLTQGFIAGDETGHTVLLGRGGSDTSGAYFAAKLSAERLEIWTDVPGMFSANPRGVPSARLLKQLHYDEAQEIASSGAKVLHPRCIMPVKQYAIPLSVHATQSPDLEGTQISGKPAGDAVAQVKAIAIKKGITLVSLDSPGMWHQVGFLASVFTVFRDQGMSIDLVSTSETNVTVSLDPAANPLDAVTLERLGIALGELCRVEFIGPCAAVSLVGRNIRGILHELGAALSLFAQQKIHLVSQAANDLNFTFVIDEAEGDRLVTELHDILIRPRAQDPVLGPTWSELHHVAGSAPAGPTPWWTLRREALLGSLANDSSAYVYDAATLRERARRLKSLQAIERVHYAIKANNYAPLLRVLAAQGLEFECVSPAEVDHVRAAVPGIDPARIFFTPNFAPREEYAWAVGAGVQLTLDNLHPLREWPELFRGTRLFVRVDTGVGRGHHQHVRTGGIQSKFGVPIADMAECATLANAAGAHIVGLHAHVGSGILGLDTWAANARTLGKLADDMKDVLPDITVLNLGGGLAVPSEARATGPDFAQLGASLAAAHAERPYYRLWIEPGRYLVAEAGVLLSRVTQLKGKREHRYVGIATGMNSLIRPALYDAHHEIYNLSRLAEPASEPYDVVGPICETGDVLGRGRLLPPTFEGDVLLIATAGAYGYVMGSNYNLRPPAAERLLEE